MVAIHSEDLAVSYVGGMLLVSQDKEETPRTVETRSNATPQHQVELHQDEAPPSYDMHMATESWRWGKASMIGFSFLFWFFLTIKVTIIFMTL